MPENNGHKPTPYPCAKCGAARCFRLGDTLLYAGLRITFKRSHDLDYPVCGHRNRFLIDREREKTYF